MRFKKVYEEMKKKRMMYNELINIIDGNIKLLKSQLKVIETHLTWDGQSTKKKYQESKKNVLSRIQEQITDKSVYSNKLDNLIQEESYYM
tara:strand:- start:103 stop:372 length:270 start_codon:yes stop_codon:yes gene_type:complete